RECFQPSKILHYNSVVSKLRNSRPVLLLIPKVTSGGRYITQSNGYEREFKALESFLIRATIDNNPDLLNVQGTRAFRNMVVPGFMNSPKGQMAFPATV